MLSGLKRRFPARAVGTDRTDERWRALATVADKEDMKCGAHALSSSFPLPESLVTLLSGLFV